MINACNKKKGICYLVGAGPGDPDLLTIRGKECLEEADTVIYDSLANPALLRYTNDSAVCIHAGKSANHHILSQSEINDLLVKHTQEGKTVVRLKGGDPFLFGRGGEEALALVNAGLNFEVIPGISSAIGGLAYAGIPVTHRHSNSILTIFSGHLEAGKDDQYDVIAKIPGTKVMLMGMDRLKLITDEFIKNGMSPETPVAIVRWATTGRQVTLIGTLENIAQKAIKKSIQSPSVVVFGDTVNLHQSLSWFQNRPLLGCRIAVTRRYQQASSTIKALKQLGADAYELPTIRIIPPTNKQAVIDVILGISQYDWIIFTSPNGVDTFFKAFFSAYNDARELGGTRIAAIGPGTAKKISEYRFGVDLIPKKFVLESLIDAFTEMDISNLNILLPRSSEGRNILVEKLIDQGAIVDDISFYSTVAETEDKTGGINRFCTEGADMITFSSASTVIQFSKLNIKLPDHIMTCSIGPITSATMKQLGLPVHIEAKQHDITGLLTAICKQYNKSKKF